MSLINQMLQDLEQRQLPAGKTEPMSGEVRAVPMASKSPALLRVGLLLGLALIATVVAWKTIATKKPVPAVAVVTPVPTPPAPAAAQPAAPVAVANVVPEQPVRHSAAPAKAEIPAVVPQKAPHEAEAKAAVPRMDLASLLPLEQKSAEPADAAMKSKPASKAAPRDAATPIKTISAAQQSDNLYRQSMTLLQQGRVVEAQDALRGALESNARNLKARQALVGLLVEGGHGDEAARLLREGLALSPEQSGFSMALARLQVESGDLKPALDTLAEGLPHAGDEAEYHAFYAALLQRDEQHDAAIQHYLTALKSNPAMPTWLVGIGISLQAQGNANDATAAYQRARDTGQLTPQLAQFVESRLKQLKTTP